MPKSLQVAKQEIFPPLQKKSYVISEVKLKKDKSLMLSLFLNLNLSACEELLRFNPKNRSFNTEN